MTSFWITYSLLQFLWFSLVAFSSVLFSASFFLLLLSIFLLLPEENLVLKALVCLYHHSSSIGEYSFLVLFLTCLPHQQLLAFSWLDRLPGDQWWISCHSRILQGMPLSSPRRLSASQYRQSDKHNKHRISQVRVHWTESNTAYHEFYDDIWQNLFPVSFEKNVLTHAGIPPPRHTNAHTYPPPHAHTHTHTHTHACTFACTFA